MTPDITARMRIAAWNSANHLDREVGECLTLGADKIDALREENKRLFSETEQAYMNGVHMTRKLLRLQLGLSVPGDSE